MGDDLLLPSPKRPRSSDDKIDDTPSWCLPLVSLVSRREQGPLRSSSKEMDLDPILQVSRRERAALLKEFKKCQRLARRRYSGILRALWYAELADEKENGSEAASEAYSEDEAEALENFLFDKMMQYDGDSAAQLGAFRETLQIQPERFGGPNANLIRDRTMNLWEGLRRVYFGITESSPARGNSPNRRPSIQGSPRVLLAHETQQEGPAVIEIEPVDAREIAALRREIAQLEERARRYRQADTGRPSPEYHRGNDEDDDDPSSSIDPSPSFGLVSGTRVSMATSSTTPSERPTAPDGRSSTARATTATMSFSDPLVGSIS